MKKYTKNSSKKLQVAFLLLRLQPQHNGHTNLIFKAMMENDLVIVMPGSSQEKRTKRNPLSTPEKLNNLKQTFGGESSKLKYLPIRDIGAATDKEWTDHVFDVIEKKGLPQPNKYYAGDSVNAKFFRDCINPYTGEKIEVIQVNRLATGIMSGSEIRDAIHNNCESWKEHVPVCLVDMIEKVYPKELINKKVEN
jgi:nicotinamide mononucleotide adenylyltransferase